jgi:drug/metabolite transporter (DMT)-like permease
MPILVLAVTVLSQAGFTASDYLARRYMGTLGFHLATFISGWIVAYFGIRLLAVFGQLFVYSQEALGKGSLLYSAVTILMTPAVGVIFLNERPTPGMVIGAVLIIIALYFITTK